MSILDTAVGIVRALRERRDSAPRTDTAVGYIESAWLNLANGLGGSGDQMSYQAPGAIYPLRPQLISTLMLGDWVARRMFRNGAAVAYHGESDRDRDLVRDVQVECDSLLLWRRGQEAATWGRGFGGSIIHVVTDDGKVDQPLVPERVRKVFSLDVYDPNEVTPKQAATWDPFDPACLRHWPDHESYRVSSSMVQIPALHPSRVAAFGGILTARADRWSKFSGWDASVLQPPFDQLREFSAEKQSISRMLANASIKVLKIPNLWALISDGQKTRLQTRLRAASMSSNVGNTYPIDGDEELSFVERTFAGVRDLGEFELLLVAGAAEMPATILFGRSPAGMNATGESDTDAWLAVVGAWQTATYGPPVTQIVQPVARTMGATDPDAWGVIWPNLEPLSLKATAALEFQIAQADLLRIDLGMPADVIMRHRYGAGQFDPTPPIMTEDDLEAMVAVAEAEAMPVDYEPTYPPGQPDAPNVEPAEAVDPSTALNGAQVTALLEVVQQVVQGQLPRESAVEIIISAFPVGRPEAERILGTVGKSFEPESQSSGQTPEQLKPFTGQPTDDTDEE
jgi:hypothetical protein